jgi:WD40 repeat protein
MVASGGVDERICVWDLASGKLFKRFEGGGGVGSLTWSADGGVLVSAGSDCGVRFWDVEGEGDGLLHMFWTKRTNVHEVRYSRSGLVFTVGSFNPA